MAQRYILDTKPFVILTVGLFNKRYLEKVGFRWKLEGKDFDLLSGFLQGKKIIVTPQVLAETCNIVESRLKKDLFKEYMEYMMVFFKEELIEIYVEKEKLLDIEAITKFGFTDISVYAICGEKEILIVGDQDLHGFCKKKNKEVKFLDEILIRRWEMKS